MPRSLKIMLFACDRAGVDALRLLGEAGHHVVGCSTHATPDGAMPSVADSCALRGVPCVSEDGDGDGDDDRNAAASLLARGPIDRPDLIVCAGYRRAIAPARLALPTLGTLVGHPAPWPHHGGPFAVEWGILRGERAWGVSVRHILPAGERVHGRPVFVQPSDNAYGLLARSLDVLGPLLAETVQSIARDEGTIESAPYPSAPAAFPPELPFGGRIDWTRPAREIEAFVRALDFGRFNDCGGYVHLRPPAGAVIGGRELGLWRASAGGANGHAPPGSVIRCDNHVWIQAGQGHLALHQLCDAAGVDHDAARYFAASPFSVGSRFETGGAWYNAGRQNIAA